MVKIPKFIIYFLNMNPVSVFSPLDPKYFIIICFSNIFFYTDLTMKPGYIFFFFLKYRNSKSYPFQFIKIPLSGTLLLGFLIGFIQWHVWI